MKILLLFLLLLYARCLYAQTDAEHTMPSRIGIFGGYNRTFHNADFRALPGIPNCCEKFGDGNGNGFSVGALYEWPLSSFWTIAMRAGYATHGATLTAREQIIVNGVGQGMEGTIEHRMTAGLSSIGIQPMAGYRLIDRLSIYAGTRIGLMVQTTYEQKELLIEPTSGTFENGSTTRNERSGTIPEAARFSAALSLGLGYELPMNASGTVLLSPEVFYYPSLTPVVTSYTWYSHALQGGLSLKYLLGQPENNHPPDTIPAIRQTPVVPPQPEPSGPPVLSAAIMKVTGFTPDGKEYTNPELTVTEYRSTTSYTLLPYIFFDENSSEIPARYARVEPAQRELFMTNLRSGDSILQVYRNILNIIGKRLTLHPDATLTLTGCNAGTGKEKGNSTLSKDRALAIRDYLENVWLIARKRIEIKTEELPDNPSSLSGDITAAEAQAENRRVEIKANIPDILASLSLTDTLREVQPQHIRFYPSIRADAGLNEWKLAIYQGESIAERTGTTNKPEVIDWNIADSEIPQGTDTLAYILELWDNDRYTRTRPKYLPLRHISLEKKQHEGIADKEVQTYHLMLFDFDKTTISKEHLDQLEAVNSAVTRNASISITGYTDALGDAAYNKRLSLERAQAVGHFLHADNATVQGGGESSLYDNAVPEGRFYNRNVVITVVSTR